MFPRNPVDAFATAGLIGKRECQPAAAQQQQKHSMSSVLQFSVILLWFASLRRSGLCLDLAAISLPQWLAFLLLACYGQSLNVGIFQAIGHDGVYYGFKLGKVIPWVNGWPFDSVSHPQYVGSVLTVWGLVALVWGQAPAAALGIMAGFWTLVYVVTAVQEQYL
uniref:phosphatidyl-N-methylethanolamine N-methyltransferase n=1 Tax=Tetradesmus obliquus TaxID=3088 RepID=A0A383V562_TETOB|eukprot:jgi/Sobl393_1/6973/SZX60241.1